MTSHRPIQSIKWHEKHLLRLFAGYGLHSKGASCPWHPRPPTPAVFSQEEQATRAMANFDRCPTELDKCIYLEALLDRNESLYYHVVTEYIKDIAPIIYTPTVGQASQKYEFVFRKPWSLYKKLNLFQLMIGTWLTSNNSCIVI